MVQQEISAGEDAHAHHEDRAGRETPASGRRSLPAPIERDREIGHPWKLRPARERPQDPGPVQFRENVEPVSMRFDAQGIVWCTP